MIRTLSALVAAPTLMLPAARARAAKAAAAPIHGIACPSERGISIGELLNWRPQTRVPHP